MKKDWLYAACLAWMVAACSGTPQRGNEELCSVDVAGAMENLTELKLSELGKDVGSVIILISRNCVMIRSSY